MTSTRSTMPAPPPNGVSSTWPPLSGVWSRGFSVRTSWPAASAFATWRWARNHSNHSGNSVTTSSCTVSRPRGRTRGRSRPGTRRRRRRPSPPRRRCGPRRGRAARGTPRRRRARPPRAPRTTAAARAARRARARARRRRRGNPRGPRPTTRRPRAAARRRAGPAARRRRAPPGPRAPPVDGVEEPARVLFARRRLGARARRVRGPPAAADDLAVVVLGDGQLEDDGPVVLLELLDGHGVGLIDERPRQVLEQLPHRERRSAALARGRVDALGPQQLADLRRGLGALAQPLADPLLVQANRRRLGLRVVLAHGLDEAPVARRALVGHHDPPDRVLPAAHTGQPQSYCHAFLSSFKATAQVSGPAALAPRGRASCRARSGASACASGR